MDSGLSYVHSLPQRVSDKFVEHYLRDIQPRIYACTSQSAQRNLKTKVFMQFDIPVPSIPIQDFLVFILDRLDSYTHDLSSGLPAEIETRQKQYEWWRDALLNFRHLDIP